MDVAQKRDRRANQKRRTRAAIVEAAIALLRAGARPTVADAAEAALVSRATAYRYFPTQETLLTEAAAIGPVESIERLFDDDQSSDAEERVLKLVERFNAIAFEEEAPMRMALRAYLDAWFAAREGGEPDRVIREGRRTRWLDTALEPALAGGPKKKRHDRLRAALALTLGIEPIIVMKDVCGLDDAEAQAMLRWTARTLVRAAL
jgi:AcrR family transcriptional regulator